MASGPQTANVNAGSSHDPSPPATSVSWDGDRMFNIYIYDYCLKRGYQKTARELLVEAEIPAESQPPINAKQGLLFEWWSVFWVLFTAKSSGTGSDDALLYVQHQQQQQQNAQRQVQAPNRIPQQPANRFPTNGLPRPAGMPQTAPMPNGLPTPNGPPPPGQPPIPNGAGPSSQPPLQPGMRPGPGGQQQPTQQRAPNGAPYQSPTIAHSPQHSGATPGAMPGQPAVGVPGMVGSQAPLTHMNRGNMLPPGAPAGSIPGGPPPMMGQPGAPGQTPQPGFPPLGSQPGSPAAQSNITGPSPRMTPRQPPGVLQQDPRQQQLNDLNKDLTAINGPVLTSLKAEIGLGDKDFPSLTVDEKRRIVELARSKGRLPPLKAPMVGAPPNAAGPSGSHLQPPTPQQRPMQIGQQQPSGPPGQIPPRPKRSSTSPGEEHSQLPRNESSPPANKKQRTSPGGPDAHGQLPQQPGPSGQPPQPLQPPMAPMIPFPSHPQQVGGPGGPHNMPNGMMGRPGMPGMPFPGQPGGMTVNMGQQPGMGGNPPGMPGMQGMTPMGNPQMGSMSPGMMHPGAPGMNPQMAAAQQMQYRQSMHNLHKNNIPPGALSNMLPGGAGSPPSNDHMNSDGPQSRPGTGIPGMQGHFNPAGPGPMPGNPNPGNRPQPGQPLKPMGGMMPPPSPSMKHTPGPDKPGDNHTNPPTPGSIMSQPPMPGMPPGPGPQPPQQHGGTAPPTPVPHNSITAPSPPPMMHSLGSQPGSQDMFATDFMNSVVTNPLDEFDINGSTMDFERDFGDWFSHDTALERGGL